MQRSNILNLFKKKKNFFKLNLMIFQLNLEFLSFYEMGNHSLILNGGRNIRELNWIEVNDFVLLVHPLRITY